MIRVLRARRFAVIASLTLAAVLVSVLPASAAEWTGRYSIWRQKAFVTQYKDYSCVGATIQITVNLVNNRRDRSKRRQLTYLDYAQQNSLYSVTDQGADAEGWAKALIYWGAGDYGWSADSTIQAALKNAAQQLRATGKAVGLLTFRGGHAWLMTGFESTADPALTSDFTVTAAEVLGPLWPNGTYNGRSLDPGPRTWMSVARLGQFFNPYRQPNQALWYGRYVTVVPQGGQLAQGADLPTADQPTADNPAAGAANLAPASDARQLAVADLHTAAGWGLLVGRLALRDLIWPR